MTLLDFSKLTAQNLSGDQRPLEKTGRNRKAKRVGEKLKSIKMNYYFKVLQNYAKFSGRARRKEYWMFVLFNLIFGFAFGFICGLIGVPDLANLYTLAVLLPSIAVAVRRMHDVGKSGWFLLIPIYNFILAVTEGEKGENQYGQDPKSE